MPNLNYLTTSLLFNSIQLKHVTPIVTAILTGLKLAAPNVKLNIISEIKIEAKSFDILIKQLEEIFNKIDVILRIAKVKTSTMAALRRLSTTIDCVCPVDENLEGKFYKSFLTKKFGPCPFNLNLWRFDIVHDNQKDAQQFMYLTIKFDDQVEQKLNGKSFIMIEYNKQIY